MRHQVIVRLLVSVAVLGLRTGVADAQRAPCYECELFKEEHPDSHPYEETMENTVYRPIQIRSHCTYPCECPPPPICRDGVHLITDGCGCCRVCARQQGDMCDGTHLCDEEKGLVCEYPSETASTGTCKAIKGAPCQVGNRTYDDGESFMPDCRTQCSCQNGTYGCVSLCTRENLRPSSSCINPRLVPVPGKCCREWMCDVTVPVEPKCSHEVTEWSPCSVWCGVGTSVRLNNNNAACLMRNETRLCQVRPCSDDGLRMIHLTNHHVRRGHECKPTLRSPTLLRLRYGNCTSVRHFRPKFCGRCRPGICCEPAYTVTHKEDFECAHRNGKERRSLYLMVIKKCECRSCSEGEEPPDITPPGYTPFDS